MQNSKQQSKWNRFVASLIEHAGLPKTCLVRLTFMNTERQKYEITNYDELEKLATSYGDTHSTLHYITLHIVIEVLALTFDEYQKRYKYEQDRYMKQHHIKPDAMHNNLLTPQQKALLTQFVLPALTTTKAVIQRRTKPATHNKQDSQSPSIMDMLNVNQPANAEPHKQDDNDVLKLFDNYKPAQSETSKVKESPALSAAAQPSASLDKPADALLPKRQLSCIYSEPTVSFEEFRYTYYVDTNQWQLAPKQEEDAAQEAEEEEEDEKGEDIQLSKHQIIVHNWPPSMNKLTLQTVFAKHGKVLFTDTLDKYATVQYDNPLSAEKAIKEFDGFQIGAHKLKVEYLPILPRQQEDEESIVEEQPEAVEEEEEEEAKQEENRKKLVIGNWPRNMNENFLRSLFSPYGSIVDVRLVNECGFVEYDADESAERAMAQLNGFQMGENKLTVEYTENNQMTHILQMEENAQQPPPESAIDDTDEDADDNVVVSQPKEDEIGDFEEVGYPPQDASEPEPEPELEAEPESEPEPDVEHQRADELQYEQEAGAAQTEHEAGRHDIDMEQAEHDGDDNEQPHHEKVVAADDLTAILNRRALRPKTPNEHDIEEMVKKEENEKDAKREAVQKVEESEKADVEQRNDEDEESSCSSLSTSDSDATDSSLSDSDETTQKLRKKDGKKLSKAEVRRLKRKQKKRKQRKLKKKKSKKLKRREKYVDKNIVALNECLEKFTNLMSSVSQSAMVMQQSVAQMSQLHAQQQQQSMMYQQSLRSILPNQPLYTSIVPTTTTAMNPPQPGTSRSNTEQNVDISQSMQNIINEISNTQGGPEHNQASAAMSASPHASNKAASMDAMDPMDPMQQQMQQIRALQQLQQQQIQLQQQMQKANTWVNANYAKPSLEHSNNDNNANSKEHVPAIRSSSPILSSTNYNRSMRSPLNNSNSNQILNILNRSGNAMNLSGSSQEQQPGNDSMESNQQSKSKIFEHKKQLKNVSPEMEEKLQKLVQMGYSNRTFNLVLLKQENGDMEKVVENLKQFYKES